MNINSKFNDTFVETLGMVTKLVAQYIESGELRPRFSAFDKDAVPFGDGYEVVVIGQAHATKDLNTSRPYGNEHGNFPPNAFSLTFQDKLANQYAVTVDPRRIRQCVGDEAKQQEYAAELTESLYQGWIEDKNKRIAEKLSSLLFDHGSKAPTVPGQSSDGRQIPAVAKTVITYTPTAAGSGVPAEPAKLAEALIQGTKAQVENIREGLKIFNGYNAPRADYGNLSTSVGKIDEEMDVAARDIVVVMSNNTAAMLDVYGFSKAFSPDYLEAANITRITSNKIPANTVLVTDTRNIQVRPAFENVTQLQNSDGSYNIFYNKAEYIEAAATDKGGDYRFVAFPYHVIRGEEVEAV